MNTYTRHCCFRCVLYNTVLGCTNVLFIQHLNNLNAHHHINTRHCCCFCCVLVTHDYYLMRRFFFHGWRSWSRTTPQLLSLGQLRILSSSKEIKCIIPGSSCISLKKSKHCTKLCQLAQSLYVVNA